MGAKDHPAALPEQVRALRRGIELGINLIDTAEIYSGGGSEEVVGEAIKDRRDSVFITTKVSPSHLHHDDVISACEGSLRRLGVKHIDLYQVHWPNPAIPIRETMNAMERLVREGKVRHIGVSNFSVEQMNEARDALAKYELASNQVEYSLTNRAIEKDILPHCKEEHITVIAYSPLARGAIPNSLIPDALLRKYKMTRAQVMLNWVTRHEEVLAIPKAARVDHVEENASSVSVRMSQKEYETISSKAM